jgi:hypothetical protein
MAAMLFKICGALATPSITKVVFTFGWVAHKTNRIWPGRIGDMLTDKCSRLVAMLTTGNFIIAH